jgi:hypothetical protein
MRRPSGTFISVMTTLLKTVALIAARPGAGEVPHSMLVGGAEVLAPMIVEFVFSAVNRMNAKGDPDGRNSKQDDPEDHEHRIETSLPMWK